MDGAVGESDFTHPSITDPFGLKIVSNARGILFFRCNLCDKNHHVVGNSAPPSTVLFHFRRHVKSPRHLAILQHHRKHNNVVLVPQTTPMLSLQTTPIENQVTTDTLIDEDGHDMTSFSMGDDDNDQPQLFMEIPPIVDIHAKDQPKLSNASIDASLTGISIELRRALEDLTSNVTLGEVVTTAIDLDIKRCLENTFAPNSPNLLYYFYQHTKNRSGFKALLAHCLLHNHHLYDTIDDINDKLHLDILFESTSTSTLHRHNLSFIFSGIIASRIEPAHITSPTNYTQLPIQDVLPKSTMTFTSIPLPSTHQDIRTNYTHGLRSLWECLPIPTIINGQNAEKNKQTHSHAKVNECIVHFLANGGVILPPEKMCLAAKNKLAAMSLPPDEKVIFIKLWSDGFEPNNVKVNRGRGIWLLTMTVIADSGSNFSNEFSNTFPLAICSSHDSTSQDIIFEKVISEINILFTSHTNHYYAHANTFVKIRISILLVSMDQPERRKRNYLLLGNSKPSSRWGYLIPDISEIGHKIPSCPQCFQAMKNDSWDYIIESIVRCEICFKWDSSLSSKKQKITHQYLNDAVAELNQIVEAEPISLNKLSQLVIEKGLNDAAANNIYDHHHKALLKGTLTKEIEEEEKDIEDDVTDDNKPSPRKRLLGTMNGSDYTLWTGSPLWKSLSHDIDDVIDVPMHMVFLGLVKATMSYVSDFIKKKKISSTFQNIVNHKMGCLIDKYTLSWLVLLPFKNRGDTLSTTGWVAENLVAFSRIFLWFISSLRLLDETRTFVSVLPPTDPVQFWNRQALLNYVRKHRLRVIRKGKTIEDTAKATDKELRCVIIDSQNSNDDARSTEPETNQDNFNCNVEDVISMVRYLHLLVSALMAKRTPTKNTRNEIERYSRLYLSMIYKVASNLGVENVHLRLWNCQSLLNLGLMHERYGDIDLIWEGGIAGEAAVKKCKEEKGGICQKNWTSLMMKSVYRRRSLSFIRGEMYNATNRPTASPKLVYSYKSHIEIVWMINHHMPISVYKKGYINCFFYCLKGAKGNFIYLPLQVSQETCDDIGVWYSIAIDKDDSNTFLPRDSIDETFVAVVLLPSFHLIGEFKYMVCSSNWI